MSFSIPLASILALATMAQAPQIGPFVGDEVAIVVHIDLAKWDVPTSARKVFGPLVDDSDLSNLTKLAEAWSGNLKKAGATDLYVLIDLADMPGLPVVVVPISNGADARAIGEAFTGPQSPIRWPGSSTIRGSVVAGSVGALARLKTAKAATRPEVAAALAIGGDAPIQVALTPSKTQRRAIEESMPILPPELGSTPISVLSKGMSWASITLTTEPRPLVRVTLQAQNVEAAKALGKIARDGLDALARSSRLTPSIAELADAIDRMKPIVTGDQVTLEADLEKTAALVSVPIRQSREAVRRRECINNLKQIGLAMHNYHSAHNSFPPAFVASPDGKPLLSWRVLILPFIEQKALFDEFHLDEAWDSPHNKPLIARMPKTYRCPSAGKNLAVEGKTSYLAPRGPATIFPGLEAIKIQQITDGTSNTILAVEANDEAAVIWTKPDDWETTPEFRTLKIFGHHPLGTEVLFGDGSVRFLKQTIAPGLLKAMTTRNAGEVLTEDDQ